MLLVPGVIENSFFYADNVVAAGLHQPGLRLFRHAIGHRGTADRRRAVRARRAHPAGHRLFRRRGAAPHCPAASGLTRHGAIALLAAIAGGAVAWLGPLLLMGVTPLDIVKVGKLTLQLWDRQISYPRHFASSSSSSVCRPVCLATLGVVALIRQRAFMRLAFLLVPIVVINAAFAGSLWQSRALLGMAPFVVALTAIGLLQLVPQPGTGRVGLWARGAAAAAIALMLLVPMKPAYDDGPHHLLGRIPGIVDWRDWQDGVAAEVAAIRDIAAADRPGLQVVITDTWNPDRYLHVALIEAGYRAQRPAEIEPACVAIAESFERDGARVLHVRLFQGFVKYYPALIRERFETMARPCLDAVAPDPDDAADDGGFPGPHAGQGGSRGTLASAAGESPREPSAQPVHGQALAHRRRAGRCRDGRRDEPGLCHRGGRDQDAVRRHGKPPAGDGGRGDRSHPPHHSVSERGLTGRSAQGDGARDRDREAAGVEQGRRSGRNHPGNA